MLVEISQIRLCITFNIENGFVLLFCFVKFMASARAEYVNICFLCILSALRAEVYVRTFFNIHENVISFSLHTVA